MEKIVSPVENKRNATQLFNKLRTTSPKNIDHLDMHTQREGEGKRSYSVDSACEKTRV